MFKVRIQLGVKGNSTTKLIHRNLMLKDPIPEVGELTMEEQASEGVA